MFDIIRCCFLFTLFVITDIILLDDKKGIFCVLIESSDYMPKYYLVATDINGVTNILLSKEKITKLDKFIYDNFSSIPEILEKFNLGVETKLNINYKYNNNYRKLDLILRNSNYNFSSIINSVNENNVNSDLDLFNSIINKLLTKITNQQLSFLRQKGYISDYVFENVFSYRKCDFSNSDDQNDKFELFRKIKKEFRRYLVFRKLYSGIIFLENDYYKTTNQNIENDFIQVNDNRYDNLDEVYSVYDLDDLFRLDNTNINVDGIKKVK